MRMFWRWRPISLWRLDFHCGKGLGSFYGWRLFVQLGPLFLYAWPCNEIVDILDKDR